MLSSAKDLIRGSLQDLQIIDVETTASDNELQTNLLPLNRLLEVMSNQEGLHTNRDNTRYKINNPTSNQLSFGTEDSDYPERWWTIEGVRTSYGQGFFYTALPVAGANVFFSSFSGYRERTSGRPAFYYYQRSRPKSILFFDRRITGIEEIEITGLRYAFDTYTSLDQQQELPPGLAQVIVKKLAMDIAQSYGVRLTGDYMQSMRMAEKAYMADNRPVMPTDYDAALGEGYARRYNIEGGEF